MMDESQRSATLTECQTLDESRRLKQLEALRSLR